MRARYRTCVSVLAACLTAGAALGPVQARANLLDALFGDRSELSGVLINKMGSAVLKVLHPSSTHSATRATRSGQTEMLFTTEYKGWLKSHLLTWRVRFSPAGRIEDILFQDSNPVQSAPIAREALLRLKERMLALIEEYRKQRLSEGPEKHGPGEVPSWR
jgi:hypothetical protein